MRNVNAVVFGVAVLLGAGVAGAQPAPQYQQPGQGAMPMQQPMQQPMQPPPPAQCFPECRPGYVCNQGQCVSACNPPCDAGFLCTPQGQCVSACNPPCPSGLVCAPSGQCVSACNPPCAPGQVCQNGQCLTVQTQGPNLQLQQPVLGASVQAVGPADPGWARTAGIFGIVSMVPIAIGVIGIIAADDNDVGIPVGAVLTVYEAIAVPIVAWGGGSARENPAVKGSPGLRVGGWIAYGLTLLDACVLIGIAASDGEVPEAVTASVGALGEIALLMFSLDALASANQAEELSLGVVANEPHIAPFAGLTLDARGSTSPVLGVTGAL